MRETLWLNLLNSIDIGEMKYLAAGIGTPPWEKMPRGEDDSIARVSRESYIGRLVPLSRFVLCVEDGLHYSEGIAFPSYREGARDATVAISSEKKARALWTNPEQRPWRQLPALLSFFDEESGLSFDCRLLRAAIPRVKRVTESFGIWSGGLKISYIAGEQFISGLDDFVESEVTLESSWLDAIWFSKLRIEMEALKTLSNVLYGAVAGYYKALKADGAGAAKKASNEFWRACEGVFQELVYDCSPANAEGLAKIHGRIALFAVTSYDTICPRDNARQIEAWAAHRVGTYRYLNPTAETGNAKASGRSKRGKGKNK
jgi:CRISPR system Cascade subunit CasA